MLGYNGTLFTLSGPGPTLTAATAASMLVAATPAAGQLRAPLPALSLRVGTQFRFKARGLISCAVTTPGTARFDIRLGGVIAWDSQAMPLNIVAQTNVWWKIEIECVVRQEGVTNMGLLWGQGEWLSPASINTAAPATGPGPGGQLLPYGATSGLTGTLANTAGFDTSVPNVFDSFFTQTVATGSMTCEMAELTILN
jgi:hypothetical protein